MNVITISDLHDTRIAAYRNITDAELVRRRGLFIAEGRLIVARVLADRRCRVESLMVNAASLHALRPVLETGAAETPVFLCDNAVFAGVTGLNLHRGCLALVRVPSAIPWREAVNGASLVVVLEAIGNADNVGGVFRNAAAFGAGAVLLSPSCCDPLYRKAIRTSMGAVLAVPFSRIEPWPDALTQLSAAGFRIAAMSLREPSLTLDTFALSRDAGKIALLIGAEGSGLTDAAERVADVRVRVPISGRVDSLNLAVAAGIALSRLA